MNFKHGYRHTSTYNVWVSIIGRCCNPTNAAYERYGGRGIKMCQRWRISFQNFLDDMGEMPTEKSIDRIDNNRGYEPGNCRWATRKEQANNRRPRSCWRKDYFPLGVSFKKDKRKWKAYVVISKKQVHIGYFDTKEQAIEVRKMYVEKVL